MKNISVLLILLFFTTKIFSQAPCNDDIIMAVKGKWKTSSDDMSGRDKTFPASQYTQLKTRLDKMATLFQEAYPEPVGIEATWYRSARGNAIMKNGPVPYQYNSLYKSWYCNPNLHKIMLGTETGTWAYVFVNDLHWFLHEVVGLKIGTESAYYLPRKAGNWKGMILYDPGSTAFQTHRAVIITRNDIMPFTPVTRLQYLQAIKQNLENEKRIQLDINQKMIIQTDEAENASRQKGMEAYVKSFRSDRQEKARENFLKNYKTDKQRKEEDRQRLVRIYASKLQVIEGVWNSLDEGELEQPAVINPGREFKEFASEENEGRAVVLINENYFNLKLARHAPQFMVLYWRTQSNNNAPSQEFKKQFEANFPLEKLKAMIDK